MNKFGTYKIVGALVLFSLWVATGCKKTPIAVETDPLEVTFSLQSQKATPQNVAAGRAVSDDEFLPYSMIGLFAGENPLGSIVGAQYSNVGYKGNLSTIWSAPEGTDPIYFPDQETAMDFYAYHPYSGQAPTATSFTSGNTWIDYTLPLVQSSKGDLKTADLLWGRAIARKGNQGTVNIEFEHKLAKLSLSIKQGSDWVEGERVELSAIEVSGVNVVDKATLEVTTGNLTTAASGSSSTVRCDFSPSLSLSKQTDADCDFILIPGSADDIKLTFFYSTPSGGEVSGDF